MTKEELKEPTPEKMSIVYEALVEGLMNLNRDDFKQMPFQAMEVLPFPELHEASIPELSFYKQLLRLMRAAGLHDCTLTHLMNPEYKSTKRILSALINFAKFREERLAAYQDYTKKAEELQDMRFKLQRQNEQFEHELGTLTEARAKVEPVIKKLNDEYAGHCVTVNKSHKEVNALKDDIKAVKNASTEVNESIANLKFQILNAKQENDKLSSQIVKSPQKLKKSLKDMAEEVDAKEEEVSELSLKLRELQSKLQALEKLENKLVKRNLQLDECKAELEKGNAVRNTIKAAEHSIDENESSIRELVATEEHLRRQQNNENDRIFANQSKHEKARYMVEQAQSEAEKKKMEAEYYAQGEKAKVVKNLNLVERKKQELEFLKAEHTTEMAQMKERYAQFGNQLVAYHKTILSAMNATPITAV